MAFGTRRGIRELEAGHSRPESTSANASYIGYTNRLTKLGRFRHTDAMGRPPLSEAQVRDRVLAYCTRYRVSPGPEGLPPFPSGKRETPQHREWLTVYRAHQRSRLRAATSTVAEDPAAPSSRLECPICSRGLQPNLAVPYPRPAAGSARPASLHPACAELARLAEALGPTVVAGLGPFLWPTRPRKRLHPRAAGR